MRSHPRRRRLVLAAVALVALIGVAVAIVISRQPGDYSNPDVEFKADDTTPRAPTQSPAGRKGQPRPFTWAFYGYDKARTRYLPLDKPFRPPFAERWKRGGGTLLEFPPVLGGLSLYILKDDGLLQAISRTTGRVRWKRRLGTLAASSPAYARGTLYVTLLTRGKGINAGRIVAVSAKTGRTRWSVRLPSRTESSPLVDRGKVYFGAEDGTVYALGIGRGQVVWTHKAPGAVKAGLALDDGKLFVAAYGGTVEALRPRDGKVLWRKGTSGTRFGLRSGNFYATPSAAFGRVYVGNTDGFVYSFAQSDGRLAWRKKTGGYVYSSAAVADVPGTAGPTVYVGSYDRNIYALDARDGSVRWKRHTEGRVSGGVVLLGDLLFYSTLARTTSALRARDGKKLWFTRRGGFNPVVSTGRGIFLVGYTSLFGLDGRPPTSGPQAKKDRQARYREAQRRIMVRRVLQRNAARARRVDARRAAIRRRNALIASGARFCSTTKSGQRSCYKPRPLFCAKRKKDGRTVCKAYRPKPARP